MIRLVFIGFGTVARGTLQILRDRAEFLRTTYGFEAMVVGVATRRGSVQAAAGLDLTALLACDSLEQYPDMSGIVRGASIPNIVESGDYDALIEVSATDLSTGEPAITSCRAALERGKGVITANKGPVALAFRELSDLARNNGAFFGYEGTVMGGTPALRLAREALAGCQITAVRGILNGTTNYMLTQMEAGQSYADALIEAQRLGYAEADPRGDVDGHDAAGKVAILANVVLGAELKLSDVETSGIRGISAADMEMARAAGERWKLIGSAVRNVKDGTIRATVRAERLPLSDPLAGVGGVSNAITYQTDLMGAITLIGAGAGGAQTGFAILSDLLEMHRDAGR